jgi:peptide/nickel transport system permease protein
MEHSGDKTTTNTVARVAKYVTIRGITLFLMVAIGVFLAIIVINYGGYIDDIHRANIEESLNFISLGMRGATEEEVAQATEQTRWAMEEAYGLHQPFLLRCLRWWYQAMTFDWGISYRIGNNRFMTSSAADVRTIVLERVPYTLLLAGATNLILFFASIFVALNLSKKHGSVFDRLIITLSPLSSIPNWVYGVLLVVIFAGELHILPFSGMFDTFPPATKLGYVPIVLKHMILPVTAIFLGMFFSTVYTWRTYFLIHSGEDYIEMAKAKGLPDRILERRYVLKPTLPYILTSFTILMLTFWQGIIVLEVFFNWPGIGMLFMDSIEIKEMSVTIGIVVIFAILLAVSVFLLDIIYALVDPRIRIGGDGQTLKPVSQRKNGFQLLSSLGVLLGSLYDQLLGVSPHRSRVNQPGKRYPISPFTRLHSGGVQTPLRAYQTSQMAGATPGGYCSYLRLENNRGQALKAPGERCRCYVHNHAERIGRSYQAEVCRTNAYHQCPRLTPVPPARTIPSKKDLPSGQEKVKPKMAGGLYPFLREFSHYPAAVLGVLIILALIGVSIYTVIALPYKEAIELWGPETVSKYQIPKKAQPEWVNLFRKGALPPTTIQNSAEDTDEDMVLKEFIPGKSGTFKETITYTVDYPYDGFPQDMLIIFDAQYEKKPFVSLTWTTPDGSEFKLGNFSVASTQRYLASTDIPRKYISGQVSQSTDRISGIGSFPATEVLMKQPTQGDTVEPQKGTYTLRIDTTLFEENANLDAELILYGQVYGLAGTDDYRRDLMIPLMWGTPIALAFGFLGAITTCLLSMMIAAFGVWYDGWVDSLIQRLTEINMIIPTLPIAITIFYLYSKSIWVILGVIIILSIFGSAIKTYRAAFLQVKEAPYIEAAMAYGASNWRIIRHYLVPRIIPLMIPQLVILVPSYVFFEATLAYLQVSDPVLPTWGKVVYDALTRGAFGGYYYWVLEPIALMILTGLAFAVVGFALDSILNPRLRRM